MLSKDLPNYFIYYGPYGHGSGAPMIKAMTDLFFKAIKKIQMENTTTMLVKPKAVAGYNEHAKLYLRELSGLRVALLGSYHQSTWISTSLCILESESCLLRIFRIHMGRF